MKTFAVRGLLAGFALAAVFLLPNCVKKNADADATCAKKGASCDRGEQCCAGLPYVWETTAAGTSHCTCGQTQVTTPTRDCSIVGRVSVLATATPVGTSSNVTIKVDPKDTDCANVTDGKQLTVSLLDEDGTGSTLSPASALVQNGEASATLTAGATGGSVTIKATVSGVWCTATECEGDTTIGIASFALKKVGVGKAEFARSVFIDGSRAYVAAPGGFTIFDVGDATRPAVVYTGAGECDDISVVGDTVFLLENGNLVARSSAANPTAMTTLSSVPTGVGNYRWGRLFIQGNYAYVTDRICDLRIVDISDPRNMRVVATLSDKTNPLFSLDGSRLYAATTTPSVYVFDVSNPVSPTEIGMLNLKLGALDRPQVRGSGASVYVAGIDAGLWIVDGTDAAAPLMVGALKPSDIGVGYVRGVHDMYVDGSNVYVAGQSFTSDDLGAVVVVDVSRPSRPYTAAFELVTRPDRVVVNGNRIYVADDIGVEIIEKTAAGP
jgi:hypothetical protein